MNQAPPHLSHLDVVVNILQNDLSRRRVLFALLIHRGVGVDFPPITLVGCRMQLSPLHSALLVGIGFAMFVFLAKSEQTHSEDLQSDRRQLIIRRDTNT